MELKGKRKIEIEGKRVPKTVPFGRSQGICNFACLNDCWQAVLQRCQFIPLFVPNLGCTRFVELPLVLVTWLGIEFCGTEYRPIAR